MYHRWSKFLTSILFLLLLACHKPAPAEPITEEAPTPTETLTITGSYHLPSCRQFFDHRRTPTGELVRDDTLEPQSCNQAPGNEYPTASPFQLKTFRFPTPNGPDLHGLRITLDQSRLLPAYRFTTDHLRLSTSTDPNFEQQACHTYAFAIPGKQALQIFFPDTTWQHLQSTTEKLEFIFQIIRGTNTPCPTPHAPCPTPSFTILQGHYNPATDLVNLQDLPDLPSPLHHLTTSPHAPQFQFHFIDSLHRLRIRSIYTLLTEDFAVWTDEADCQNSRNWDIYLTSAAGYNLLELQFDPPYLKCLKRAGVFQFRIAVLR